MRSPTRRGLLPGTEKSLVHSPGFLPGFPERRPRVPSFSWRWCQLWVESHLTPSLAFNLLVWLQGVPGCPFCSSWAPRAGEHGACSACPQDALDPAWKVSVHPRIPAGQRGCTETPDAPATDSSAPAPQAGARADAPERPAPEPTATGCRPRPPARTTGPPLADPATGARPSPGSASGSGRCARCRTGAGRPTTTRPPPLPPSPWQRTTTTTAWGHAGRAAPAPPTTPGCPRSPAVARGGRPRPTGGSGGEAPDPRSVRRRCRSGGRGRRLRSGVGARWQGRPCAGVARAWPDAPTRTPPGDRAGRTGPGRYAAVPAPAPVDRPGGRPGGGSR